VKLRTSRLAITGLVALHFAIVLAHGTAHRQMEIGLETWQQAFVAVAILVGPLMAVVVLWTSWKKLGAILLAVCMLGASAFGIFYHFLFPSADSIFFLKPSGWDEWFVITALLLATIETTCFGWCVWILRQRSLA
jgi:fatty-acid desaturase